MEGKFTDCLSVGAQCYKLLAPATTQKAQAKKQLKRSHQVSKDIQDRINNADASLQLKSRTAVNRALFIIPQDFSAFGNISENIVDEYRRKSNLKLILNDINKLSFIVAEQAEIPINSVIKMKIMKHNSPSNHSAFNYKGSINLTNECKKHLQQGRYFRKKDL